MTSQTLECIGCKYTMKLMIGRIEANAPEAVVTEFKNLCSEYFGNLPGVPAGACDEAAAELLKWIETQGVPWIKAHEDEIANVLCVATGQCKE